MKLRNSEKYKSPNARTARMERSDIQKITKHLNFKHKEPKIIQSEYSHKKNQ